MIDNHHWLRLQLVQVKLMNNKNGTFLILLIRESTAVLLLQNIPNCVDEKAIDLTFPLLATIHIPPFHILGEM